MKYVYVVYTINHKEQSGFRSIPVLGVHSSWKKANRHYLNILKDRGEEVSTECYKMSMKDVLAGTPLRAVKIGKKWEIGSCFINDESIKIDRWAV